MSARRPSTECPQCGCSSACIHSRYVRQVADLPWHGVVVRLELHTRRFICANGLCKQRIFCERLPSVVATYARKTSRLTAALELIGFAIGGEAGARLARELGMSVSPDTLLERVRRAASPQAETPKVLGVDDWAKRKARTYGTILIDLERRRPVDLLPDREAATLAAWLKAHPGVEIISRDRGGAYMEGATKGAPEAVQVADRWHLMKNISDLFANLLNRHHRTLRQAVMNVSAQISNTVHPAETSSTTLLETDQVADENSVSELFVTDRTLMRSTTELATRQSFREQRLARYTAVKELQAQGLQINDIRKQLGLHYTTVQGYFHADEFPERARRKCPSMVNLFDDYLRQRWAEGCCNAKQLEREIRRQGYRGSSVTVRRHVQHWRADQSVDSLARQVLPPPRPPVPTPRTFAWLLLKSEDKLDPQERQIVAEVIKLDESISHARELVVGFREMIRNRKVNVLSAWLEQARASNLSDFVNFVRVLKRDEAAVRAALTYEWSNGQTEGQINRLKYIKRQMFGRANFDLLKARVLHAN
ncbi:MAG: ISL3 family transposase [Pyrinomonadaceae bacterium MAG19_C2-C3]|nr:ISL3 family transposase [Pyrinomonadaceae bacterium MAG19_C2-C3]